MSDETTDGEDDSLVVSRVRIVPGTVVKLVVDYTQRFARPADWPGFVPALTRAWDHLDRGAELGRQEVQLALAVVAPGSHDEVRSTLCDDRASSPASAEEFVAFLKFMTQVTADPSAQDNSPFFQPVAGLGTELEDGERLRHVLHIDPGNRVVSPRRPLIKPVRMLPRWVGTTWGSYDDGRPGLGWRFLVRLNAV